MSETATERVRVALAAGQPIDRKTVEHGLREAFGMSARQAKRFAADGAKTLGVTDAPDNGELLDRVATLERALRL